MTRGRLQRLEELTELQVITIPSAVNVGAESDAGPILLPSGRLTEFMLRTFDWMARRTLAADTQLKTSESDVWGKKKLTSTGAVEVASSLRGTMVRRIIVANSILSRGTRMYSALSRSRRARAMITSPAKRP